MRDATQTGFGSLGNSKVEIGRFTYGLEGAGILQWGEGAGLTLGSFCSIASGVTIFLGGNHRTDWATTYPFGHIFEEILGGKEIVGHPATRGDVEIGHDVWIGHNATILSGVKIGNGAVIAANAHVSQSVQPYEVVGGNPARSLKFRFEPEVIELLQQLEWWNLPVEAIRLIAPRLSQAPTTELLTELLAEFRPHRG